MTFKEALAITADDLWHLSRRGLENLRRSVRGLIKRAESKLMRDALQEKVRIIRGALRSRSSGPRGKNNFAMVTYSTKNLHGRRKLMRPVQGGAPGLGRKR